MNDGSVEANSRISLYKKSGSQPSEISFYKIYAWHQPHQPVVVYSLPDHPCYKIAEIIYRLRKFTIELAAFAEALPPSINNCFNAA